MMEANELIALLRVKERLRELASNPLMFMVVPKVKTVFGQK
jgi:hypothetical protein